MAIVYRTENKINGNFYYGVTDQISKSRRYYLGSGSVLKSAILKYGRDNFVRRAIAEFDTIEEAFALEELIVDQDFVNRRDCYNVQPGGIGGGIPHTEKAKKSISEYRSGRVSWSKPITIDGVEYSSGAEASRMLGISTAKVTRIRKAQSSGAND